MGAPGPPDIVGLSWEIIVFRNWGGGPVGHPQGVQVKNANFQYKMLPKGPPREDNRAEVDPSCIYTIGLALPQHKEGGAKLLDVAP